MPRVVRTGGHVAVTAESAPERFIVRILRSDGRPAGVGALIEPGYVITCAHVVNAALGLGSHAQARPVSAVFLDFPLIPGESGRCTATVARWLPPPGEGAVGLDLAGLDLAALMLDGRAAPAGATPARLAVSAPLAGSRVRVFGYPGTPPRPAGSWVETVVRGRVGAGGGLLQLDSGPEAALRVQPGFSGSPVYDDATGSVVGLLVSAAGGRAAERDSYAISADRLALAWPEQPRPGPLGPRPGADQARTGTLTILHLSDLRLGGAYLFGGRGLVTADRAHGALLRGLREDLVELRKLEKAPSLDELLAQHLVSQGVEDLGPAKLRYMISSGRLALLFDGFDELELRVGYGSAADYLKVLLDSVTDRAKVVLTSRTQHFQSASQIRTLLGYQVAMRATSRVAVLEDFSDAQVLRFLTSFYAGDADRARARLDLLSEIPDLLGLARNPRMLGFIGELDEGRLRTVRHERGLISAAGLYREFITLWLAEEAGRQRHRRGLTSFDEQERLQACTALALRLWTSASTELGLAELSAGVQETLTRLAERGYSAEQASHSIGSGSLLVRGDEGTFTFVHQSIMEWLVANAAARELAESGSGQLAASRPMSRLTADFFRDLAGPGVARGWALGVLGSPAAAEAAKQNALAVLDRVPPAVAGAAGAAGEPRRQHLAGVDLRSQDLTGLDLRQADLRGAILRGMRLHELDLSGADLRGADLTGARMSGGSLLGARLAGSRWDRAALLGTRVPAGLAASAELGVAAMTGRDRAGLVTEMPGVARSVAFSPDGSLLAIGSGDTVQFADLADGRLMSVLHGHGGLVNAVAFAPGGRWLASGSDDQTTRIWDTAAGTVLLVLEGHSSGVHGLAFSPDGTLLATASGDHTTRIWDTSPGAHTGLAEPPRGPGLIPCDSAVTAASPAARLADPVGDFFPVGDLTANMVVNPPTGIKPPRSF